MLDRLCYLRSDGEQQVDLVLRERTWLAGAHVERTLERPVAGEDRDGENRFVLVLGQIQEILEAWVKVRL